ncbi:MAG: thiol-disulfide isomerase/thioredoxin [Saprospiraceae bacterium]
MNSRNKKINFEYFKNKITVLNFWFTACRPCIIEIPEFNRVQAALGQEKINYLAVCLDNKTEIDRILDKNPWGFDHVANGKLLYREVFSLFHGYPLTLVINEDGLIIDAFGRSDDLEKRLLKTLSVSLLTSKKNTL